MKCKSSFGKENIHAIKKSFITDAKALIEEDINKFAKISKIGFDQVCNLCNGNIDNLLGQKHGVSYYRCSQCGVVGTGKIKNYSEYSDLLYQDLDYGAYKGLEEDRLKQIYLPKAEYLLEALPDVLDRGVVEIGSGMGYFVKALRMKGVRAKGFEINRQFVNHFNASDNTPGTLPGLIHVEHDEVIEALKSEDPNQVVSMIHVLEHVEDPIRLLTEIKKLGFRHFFLAVPTFGLSAAFEFVDDNYYHRNLAPDHLYVYSNETLLWIENRLGLTRMNDWYFGQDMHDIARMLSVKNAGFSSDAMIAMFDDLQLVLDKHKSSSEIHLLWSL